MDTLKQTLASYNASYPLLLVLYAQNLATTPQFALIARGVGDNVNPREWASRLEKKLAPDVLARFKRQDAAHKNGLEALPLMFAAVVAGNTAGLSATYMNTTVLAYLVLRMIFVRLYINTTRQRTSNLRTLVWTAAQACWAITLVKAGRALNARTA